ncbi:hypothetical protein H4582DRAFT_2071979 [Lactarius indigo]|nr:hypothetical protein H4582DRAFT_2071979 [Lactarius indigo]
MRRRDFAVDILRSFTLNFRELITLVLGVSVGLIYALLYYICILVGTFVIILPLSAYLCFVQVPRYNVKGELKPEEWMTITTIGACIVPVCLF